MAFRVCCCSLDLVGCCWVLLCVVGLAGLEVLLSVCFEIPFCRVASVRVVGRPDSGTSLSVCLSVCLSVYLSVCLRGCLTLFVCLCVRSSVRSLVGLACARGCLCAV